MNFPQVLSGPDISNWAETAFITRVEFRPGDFLVRHTKEGTRPDSWPGQHVPGWGNGADDPGNIQWTLYVVIATSGWVTAPCILYYPEYVPSLGVHRGGEGAPFSSAARNWYYQEPGMVGRQPQPGDRIGVIAVAGALRGLDVQAVHERSNVCWVTVPQNDTGVFDFATPEVAAPQVPPIPLPVPVVPVPATPATPPATIPGIGPAQVTQLLTSVLTAFKAINAKLDNCATHADLTALQAELARQAQALTALLTPIATAVPPTAPHLDAATAIDGLSKFAGYFRK